MPITTVSSRDFNQHASEAKKMAMASPVFITHRGKPSHVLLSIDEFNRLSHQSNIADLLATPSAGDIELPLSKNMDIATSADFS